MKHVKRITASDAFLRIGEYFKEKRTNVGLTQSDVARALNLVSGQFVSNWERGRSLPPMDYLPRLVKLYKLNKGEVLKLYLQEQENFLRQILFK